MIRITNNMMVNSLRQNLNTNLINMDKYQEQLSTGRKINRPSDDPAGLVKSLRLRTNIAQGEQYLDNIGEAINFMETTDGALNNIGQILQRAKELTVKAANGTNGEQERGAISTEIRELNDQLKVIANTTYGTKYIFGGRNVTEAPCQDGKWAGTDQTLETEISLGVTISYNLNNQSMQNFFTDDSKDLTNTDNTGIFNFIERLAANIDSGDSDAIDADLETLDVKIDTLLTSRATLGAKVNRLELQQNRLEDTQISYTALLADNEDADMAEVIINLKMQENVYNASLSAGARIIQPSLIDFLK